MSDTHTDGGFIERMSMLVLTRREGEDVVIGDPECPIGYVRVASVKGDRVRLAFEFPACVKVNRREIADLMEVRLVAPPGSGDDGLLRNIANAEKIAKLIGGVECTCTSKGSSQR